MSNSVANSGASDFGKSEVDGSQRGGVVKGESETLSFPSVERLIAATLPFTNAEHLIEQFITCLADEFSVGDCVILWQQSETRTGQYAHLTDRQTYQRGRFACSAVVESLSVDIQQVLPQTQNWNWSPLELDGIPIGLVGFDASHQINFPSSWLQISARLLATALMWNWSLTENKLKALGEYAAGAGHEINNPLAAINGRTAQLLKGETDPHRQHLLQTIGAQTYRIRDMIGDSMLFARPPALQLAELNLYDLVEKVVHQFSQDFSDRSLSLWGNRETNIKLTGDANQLSVVISELLRNSLNAVAEGGRLEIDCLTRTLNNQKSAVLRIADNGSGFTDEEREHCFDPFYSGRQAGRGLGFGLSKCWRIVNQHRGTITLNESIDRLTEFVVILPVRL